MLKIVISVRGGVIQHIATNSHDVEIVVADYDQIREAISEQDGSIPLELNYNPDLVFENGKAHEMLGGILRDKEEILVREHLKAKGV